QRGSSGHWSPLYPSADIKDADNHVEPARTYIVPPTGRFRFNDQPGEERLFILLSRQPELDLDRMIDRLRNERPHTPESDPSGKSSEGQVVLASNVPQTDDSEVDHLRTEYARDLVVEEVNGDVPGGTKDKAVYVVNPAGGEDARVVADVRL